MTHSSKRSQPSSEVHRSTSAGRKRKLQSRHQPTGRQQSIPDVFTCQQKATSVKDDSSLSPNSKRRKQDSSAPTPPKPQTPPRTMATAEMYSFPQKRSPQSTTCIDLTGSPDPSPKARTSNGFHVGKGPSGSRVGAKKLIVKNLKAPSKTNPTEYLEQIWSKLDKALDLIFAEGKVTFPLEELYRGVENVCRQGHASTIHTRLKARCTRNVTRVLKTPLVEKAGEQNVDVLRAVLGAWARWKTQMVIVQSIFYYMDRSYLLQSPEPSLREMAIEMFRVNIFDDFMLNPRVVSGACDLIAADRNQEPLDTSTFRQAINMFHEISVYSNSFEPRMLELSQDYILQWSNQACNEMELAEYIRACVQFIDREIKRCEVFGLDTTTRKALLVTLEDLLVEKRLKRLVLRQDVAQLLQDNDMDSLEQLYALLQRRRFGSKLKPAFESWINSAGESIVFDEEHQDEMVVNLLSLKKQLDISWRVAFRKDEELGHGLREAFEAFMNKQKKTSATWNTDNSKPGEMIAKYVDMLLRGGAKAIPTSLSLANSRVKLVEDDDDEAAIDEESEVNQQLDQVLDLFRFVHGKAVFEAFYKKDLARRLLMGRSASADAERSMLQRLKTECGAGFTQNLEQMFKDIELAREEMNSYKTMIEERDGRPSLDLNVNILSAAAWPTYPDIPVIVPININAAIENFTRHYKSKHGGRKLDWKHALAHCQIKASFAKGNKELVVSSFQAVVLLLFNAVSPDEHLSYEHIKAATGLPDNEVKRTLQSLACAKLRPLSKYPKGREINDDDTFTINAGFSHEKYRVKINQVQLKETKEENKETHERVAADRAFETQAAIVRIMKSRKLITHAELVAEVIKATKSRGQLNVADIKKNIDRLIEKDYMEREENNSYSYIA
ncbi:Cullin-domain-containing protein [Viridothelium virens]|uniref:Cullin-domain-containing protein n=1 Tax=Viridothelium virens TaxID=1048519 RepID=A0A6A6HL27_VIRVR|nr:Cullin-domain-containing protein [Viridothelium virens]